MLSDRRSPSSSAIISLVRTCTSARSPPQVLCVPNLSLRARPPARTSGIRQPQGFPYYQGNDDDTDVARDTNAGTLPFSSGRLRVTRCSRPLRGLVVQSSQVRLVTPRRSDASDADAVSDILPETSKISFTYSYYIIMLKVFHILYILSLVIYDSRNDPYITRSQIQHTLTTDNTR